MTGLEHHSAAPAPTGSPLAAFTFGFSLPMRAVNLLLGTRGLKRFAVLPLVFNVLLYGLFLAGAVWLIGLIEVQVGPWEFWWGLGGWLANVINWSFGPLKWLVAVPVLLLLCYYTFTMVGLIVAAPFNDMLSERVERAICEPKEKQSLPLRVTTALMFQSMLDALGILGRQILWTLLVLPLVFVPVVGFLPLFLVGAHFAGLGYFDTSMARNNLRNRHKQPVLRVHRWEILGLGVAMQLLFLIPFVGLLMLPVGVTAGTILYTRIDWERALREAGLEKPVGFVPPRPPSRAAFVN